MGHTLLSALEGRVGGLAEALLGPEDLGRLMGLLRVNAMAVLCQADGAMARGMAIYSAPWRQTAHGTEPR